jgi:ribosomal protein S1
MYELIFGLGIGFLIAYYTITHYNHIRSFFSDILSSVGFLGKWVRKKSVESKYELVINGAVDDYNSSFEDKIIPNCKLKWINQKTDESYLEDGEAIICLKFDKKNQDLNFYNATYTFTKTALLPITRNFIKGTSQKAIDLNLTKIFIKNYNRRSLKVFNQKYKLEEQEIKESFERFEETENRGLFRTLLIPELHYLGDSLETITPNGKVENEIENFFNWFFDLATRGKEEYTNLNFRSEHLKVGVILVANLETYQAYGIEAYTKWAEKYASEHYGAVYLLARGSYRATILKEITTELKENKGFDQINKKTTLFEVDEKGEKTEITCYCLKPNLAKVQYNAWEKIKLAFNNKKTIIGIISLVQKNEIVINVNGIEQSIPKTKLSRKELPDLSKYFKPEVELILNIESIDEENGLIIFNNIETDTDPYLIIESTLEDNREIEVVVDGVRIDREGRERGLKTFCKAIKKRVFIPKKYCSYSRFINLGETFKKDGVLKVNLHGFSLEFANFYGELTGLENPLIKIKCFLENHHYKAIVQEITDNYLTTELLPGLECRIFRSELSWDNSKKTTDYSIGSEIDVVVIKNDKENYRLTGSIKRLNKSDKEVFYETNKQEILEASVLQVYDGIGLKFKLIDSGIKGFVYAKELMWGFCSNIEESFPTSSSFKVKPIEFDYNSNEILYSIKDCYRNDFEKIYNSFNIGDTCKGKVIRHFPNITRVEIVLNGNIIQAYVHKSEISEIFFIEDQEMSSFLPLESTFNFQIKRIDKRNKIVELSRRSYLNSTNTQLNYGDTIEVNVIKKEKNRAIFYENEIEGIITENFQDLQPPINVEVYLLDSEGNFGI